MKIQLLVVAVLSAVVQVSGYSYGAGQCNSGSASVAQTHLGALKTLTGSLELGNFTIAIDGVPLSANGPLNYITAGVALNVSLYPNAPSPGFFRGFLIRLGPVSTGAINTISYFNSYPTDTTIAAFCPPCSGSQVSGICHFNNLNKTIASGAMTIPSPITGLIIDVNVVVANRNNVSQYYYSYYYLSAVAKGAPTGVAAASTPAPTHAATVTTHAPSVSAVAPSASSPVSVITKAPSSGIAPTPVVISSNNATFNGTKNKNIVKGGTSSATSNHVVAVFAWMTVFGSIYSAVF